MKIEVEKWTFEDCVSYKMINFVRCCDKIDKFPCICLDNQSEPEIRDFSYGAFIKTLEYPETKTTYHKIDCCPFCGEKIEVEIPKKTNKNNEYKLLKTERYLLTKERMATDSISKMNEINEKIRKIDEEIDYFYKSDDFPNKV